MNNDDKRIKLINSVIYNKNANEFLERAEKFQEYLMMYECAVEEIITKVEILNKDLKIQFGRTPIESIESRVKDAESILDKFDRKGFELSMESITQLEDIAGVRIICSFIDDIYHIVNMLTRQDDILLINSKDYIANPKENGYRSYHMIVQVPVFFSNRTQNLKVEIQIRTIAMNFWASLEHKLKYKKAQNNENELTERLKRCADIIHQTDLEMQLIRKEIEGDTHEENVK